MSGFTISCGSTVDLPYSHLKERNISVIFYTYLIDGTEFTDDMCRDPDALPDFYRKLSEGALPVTSQINTAAYIDYFRRLLENGSVLHLEFSSGMSGSAANAALAAETLNGEYTDRSVKVIDTTCGSSGYGLLVDMAADMRDCGCSLEEIAKWVRGNLRRVHHQFFSTEMKFFRRSGRVSGVTAAIGTVLGICPLMQLDYCGRINAYGKERGKVRAIEATADWMELHAENGAQYDGYCYISHSECADSAEKLRDEIEKRFPKLRGSVKIFSIGTIIGSHSGPGTVALFFMGDERK